MSDETFSITTYVTKTYSRSRDSKGKHACTEELIFTDRLSTLRLFKGEVFRHPITNKHYKIKKVEGSIKTIDGDQFAIYKVTVKELDKPAKDFVKPIDEE